jgi:hypothetical protein
MTRFSAPGAVGSPEPAGRRRERGKCGRLFPKLVKIILLKTHPTLYRSVGLFLHGTVQHGKKIAETFFGNSKRSSAPEDPANPPKSMPACFPVQKSLLY